MVTLHDDSPTIKLWPGTICCFPGDTDRGLIEVYPDVHS